MFKVKLVGDGFSRRNKASNINAPLAAEVYGFMLFGVFPQPLFSSVGRPSMSAKIPGSQVCQAPSSKEIL